MANEYISQVQLPNNETYNIRDKELIPRLKATVGHSNKNLLEITADTRTINGVTFTVDKTAGTVTANGTASKYTVFGLISPSSFYQERGMILSGCTGGSALTYWIGTWDGSVQIANFSGETSISTQSWAQVRIVIREGVSVSNLVFKPMIRDGSISDDTFEPYQIPTDEKKQDKPVVLYDAGGSSVGEMEVLGLSNLTQYSELHITLFAPSNGDDPDGGFTHTIVHPFIFPNIPNSQVTCFDCRVAVVESGTVNYKQIGLAAIVTNTYVLIKEFDESANFINIPSNHYIYIKRIVGIP